MRKDCFMQTGMGYPRLISSTDSTHAQGEAALQALLSVSNEGLSDLRKAEAQLWLDKCVFSLSGHSDPSISLVTYFAHFPEIFSSTRSSGLAPVTVFSSAYL